MLENLGQVLPAGARRYGGKTALVSGGREFSFDELNELSGRLANGLRDLGVAPATGCRSTRRTRGSGS